MVWLVLQPLQELQQGVVTAVYVSHLQQWTTQ